MPIKILSDQVQEFILIKSDKEFDNEGEPTTISVRQATQGDFEIRNNLFANFKRRYEGNAITVEQTLSFDDIRRKEVFLTLTACNIIDDSGGKEKPLFVFSNGRLTDEAKFRRAWAKLHPIVAEEISQCVLKMNPLWSGEGELEGEPED